MALCLSGSMLQILIRRLVDLCETVENVDLERGESRVVAESDKAPLDGAVSVGFDGHLVSIDLSS